MREVQKKERPLKSTVNMEAKSRAHWSGQGGVAVPNATEVSGKKAAIAPLMGAEDSDRGVEEGEPSHSRNQLWSGGENTGIHPWKPWSSVVKSWEWESS